MKCYFPLIRSTSIFFLFFQNGCIQKKKQSGILSDKKINSCEHITVTISAENHKDPKAIKLRNLLIKNTTTDKDGKQIAKDLIVLDESTRIQTQNTSYRPLESYFSFLYHVLADSVLLYNLGDLNSKLRFERNYLTVSFFMSITEAFNVKGYGFPKPFIDALKLTIEENESQFQYLYEKFSNENLLLQDLELTAEEVENMKKILDSLWKGFRGALAEKFGEKSINSIEMYQRAKTAEYRSEIIKITNAAREREGGQSIETTVKEVLKDQLENAKCNNVLILTGANHSHNYGNVIYDSFSEELKSGKIKFKVISLLGDSTNETANAAKALALSIKGYQAMETKNYDEALKLFNQAKEISKLMHDSAHFDSLIVRIARFNEEDKAKLEHYSSTRFLKEFSIYQKFIAFIVMLKMQPKEYLYVGEMRQFFGEQKQFLDPKFLRETLSLPENVIKDFLNSYHAIR